MNSSKQHNLAAAVCALIASLCSLATAQYAGGTGAPDDPHRIYTPQQLNAIAVRPNDWDEHFKLMADIDLGSDAGFTPIGYYRGSTNNRAFTGGFDGNGHRILNLRCTAAAGDTSVRYGPGFGLFGYVRGATIAGVTVVDPNIAAAEATYVGVLAGRAEDAVFRQCHVMGGRVCGGLSVGALVGSNTGDIFDCVVSTSVSGQTSVGGVAGYNYCGTISQCLVTGEICGEREVGGVAGDNTGTISECDVNSVVTGGVFVGGIVGNGGGVSGCTSTGRVEGDGEVGGVVGSDYGRATTSCSSTASVTGRGDYTGGLIGFCRGTVTSCWAGGRVVGKRRVGGLSGYNRGTVKHCYATGDVEGEQGVGGFVGGNDGCVLFSYSTGQVTGAESVGGFGTGGSCYLCYWDVETSGVSGGENGSRGRTTSRMKNAWTYRGWGSGGQWVLDEGRDYPRLAWEGTGAELLTDAPRRYGGGTGEPNDPYRIETAEQLFSIGHYRDDLDKHFVLMADIDLGAIAPTEILPIGAKCAPFVGTFAGDGRVLSNFTFQAGSWDCAGLFGWIGPGGYVGQVELRDADVLGGTDAGGLAGCNKGTIEDCPVTGTVVGWQTVGGVAGSNAGTVSACSVRGRVEALWGSLDYSWKHSRVGGLVGYNQGVVARCWTDGPVTGISSVGGLVGYNNGDVRSSYSTGIVSGRQKVGGLVGTNGLAGWPRSCFPPAPEEMPGLAESSVTCCYVTGSAAGEQEVGGLAGTNGGLIALCYSAGAVAGTDAEVTGISGSDGGIGGLVGTSSYGTVHLSYWDIQSSGQRYSAGGRGKSTREMMTAQTFRGWDHQGWWQIDEAKDYPRLTWEGLPGEILTADSDRYGGGRGEPNDPYQIRTSRQFTAVGSHPADWGKSFVLMNDIDLGGVDPNEVWLIGVRQMPFTGVFDGGDHSVSGFRYGDDRESFPGLFGRLGRHGGAAGPSSGLVSNLHVEDVEVRGYSCAGGLAGGNEGEIRACSVTGRVAAVANNAGGLVGFSIGTIADCVTDCNVVAGGAAGTLAGYASAGQCTGCTGRGSVEALSWGTAGGLIGASGAEVIDCQFNGLVTGGYTTGGLIGRSRGAILACSATGDVTGDYWVGGLVGVSEYGKEITGCFAVVNVTGERFVGGLVGENRGELRYCYATGRVEGQDAVAGLVGTCSRDLYHCYSACVVAGVEDVAGLVGDYDSGSITACFWDTDVSALWDGVAGVEPDPLGSQGTTTEQMRQSLTFIGAGWDFVGESDNGTKDFWTIDEGADYPKLVLEAVIDAEQRDDPEPTPPRR